MPFYQHLDRVNYARGHVYVKTYVPGPRLTHFHKRALNWQQSDWKNRNTGSSLVSRWHFAWIIALHACQTLCLVVALTARTEAGLVWMSILTVLLATPTALFWYISVYLDGLAYRLNKRYTLPQLNGVQFSRLRTGRQSVFKEWLIEQLVPTAPYFGRVQPIVDSYLEATASGAALWGTLGLDHLYFKTINEALYVAADQACELLQPIYNESVEAKSRREQEEDARIARENEFCEGEEARITKARVAMAVEDMQTFSEGHRALLTELPEALAT